MPPPSGGVSRQVYSIAPPRLSWIERQRGVRHDACPPCTLRVHPTTTRATILQEMFLTGLSNHKNTSRHPLLNGAL